VHHAPDSGRDAVLITKAGVLVFSSCVADDPTPPAPPTTRHPLDPRGQVVLITEQRFPRREATDGEGGGIGERELVRNPGEGPVVDRDTLRPAAVPGPVADSQDAVADAETASRRAHIRHHPGELPSEDDAPARRGAPHPPYRGFARIDPDRANRDQQIAGTQLRLGHIDQFQREGVERMGLLVPERLHRQRPAEGAWATGAGVLERVMVVLRLFGAALARSERGAASGSA
jgi:hypothetical protein